MPVKLENIIVVCQSLLIFFCFVCSLCVCQLGDIFDRGDDDLLIQEWVYRLARDAGRSNGAVYSIMGNHEVFTGVWGGRCLVCR